MSELLTQIDRDENAVISSDSSKGATSDSLGNTEGKPGCAHCGLPCEEINLHWEGRDFCCRGCVTVFQLLNECGLRDFYNLPEAARVKGGDPNSGHDYGYLDEPETRERLVDYSDEKLTKWTVRLPAIHCIACVWLLENLYRLQPGVGRSRVHFPKKELTVALDTQRVRLSEVARLLALLGYEPELKLSLLDRRPGKPLEQKRWIQLGVAGFAFGNIMLFSLPVYLGMDAWDGPRFQTFFGFLNAVLALPVLLYSAGDYWMAAWRSLRHRLLNVEVPIALGMAALFAQSLWEVFSGTGEGYFDTFTGLVFFLLCGRAFQQRTYHWLAFDRDFSSFFPLSVLRLGEDGVEERVSVSRLRVGDALILRHGDMLPADSRLIRGRGLFDFSFVTGESEPVEKKAGDYLYAGGRQMGGAVEAAVVKPVSHGYLTSLWNQESFQKPGRSSWSATNQYSQYFTWGVLGIAMSAAGYWAWADPSLMVKTFVAVLIVACPCALALAAPFALGAAARLFESRGVFMKNPQVIEDLSRVQTVVFDKTGTLTSAGERAVEFHGEPLKPVEREAVAVLAAQSSHPLSARIRECCGSGIRSLDTRAFEESPGQGIQAIVGGRQISLGSEAWFRSLHLMNAPGGASRAASVEDNDAAAAGSRAHVAIDGLHRGVFILGNRLRSQLPRLFQSLSARYTLHLLSGDTDSERLRFEKFIPDGRSLLFGQSPLDKQHFIRERQRCGERVMMVGDGLNDAGALRQSDVGVAVMESLHGFSPASDVIVSAEQVSRIDSLLRASKHTVRVIWFCLALSTLYNAVGLTFACRGMLSPVLCAILMPLSSITVAACAVGGVAILGRFAGRERGGEEGSGI